MHRNVLIIALCILLTAAASGCVIEFENAAGMISGIVKEHKETVELGPEQQDGGALEAELDMKMARVTLDGTSDKLLDAKFRYNNESLKPEVAVRTDELQIRNGNIRSNINKPVNWWDVRLTDQVPLEMKLHAEASEIDMKLGGMKLQDIDGEIRGSTMKLDFDRPNRSEMERLKLDAKAGSADLYALGNSGFRRLDMTVEASRLFVDLSGEYVRDGEVRIEARASTIKLKVPEDIGVNIVVDRFDISTVRVENDRILSQSEKEYRSGNYGSAKINLEIIIDMNMTTLTVE